MMDTKSDALEGSLPPGFRFHPTDEELILYYLRNRVTCNPYPISVVSDVDIYKFDPWDLPDQAEYGEREWYFFSPRDRKYPNGARPNRAAGSGYWKATGTDKPIHSGSTFIGVKKALVFYKGRPPKGSKTEWVMHEYRLAADSSSSRPKMGRPKGSSMKLDDWVLCRIYKKKNFDPVMEVEKRDKYRVLDEGPATSFRSTAEDHRQQQQHIEMMKFPRPPSFSTLMHADYYGLLPLSMDRFGYEDLSPFPICDNSATMVGTSNDYQQAMNTMPYQMYHP